MKQKPWEKQSGESPKAYEAFLVYRDTEPAARSIQAAAAALGKSKSQLEKWSVLHRWQARIAAFDAEQQKILDAEHLKSLEENAKLRAEWGREIQNKAMAALEKVGFDKLSVRELSELIQVGMKIEDDAFNLMKLNAPEAPGKSSSGTIKLYDSSIDLDRV